MANEALGVVPGDGFELVFCEGHGGERVMFGSDFPMCEKGVDEDFGKAAEKMFPVVDPPFYAITYDMLKHTSVEDVSCMRLLVTMGGLVTDDNARVLDDDSNPIPGLFAVGNVQGGRFVEDYPFTLSGASHAAALTYGYLTGKYLAEQA